MGIEPNLFVYLFVDFVLFPFVFLWQPNLDPHHLLLAKHPPHAWQMSMPKRA